MKKTLAFLFVCLIAIACNPEKKYKEQLINITSQKNTIDSLNEVFNEIDYDSLVYIKDKAAEYERIVKEKYNADTINSDFASMMSTMKSVRKSLSSIEINKMSTEKELAALKTQFKNLEIDIKNGVLNKDQIANFLNEENLALEKFSFNFNAVNQNQIKQKENFKRAQPTVSMFIDLINKN